MDYSSSTFDKERLSKTISCLRFPLTVLVVFIHFDLSSGLVIRGVSYGLNNPSWYYILIDYISNILSGIAVPVFFFISGFLFFYNSEFNYSIYKRKLIKRLRTLFIPYIIWNTITLLWTFKCFVPYLSSFFRPHELHFSISRLLCTFFHNNHQGGIVVLPEMDLSSAFFPINEPLWFVRDLMTIMVLSPFIFLLVKFTRRLFVPIILCLWLFVFSSVCVKVPGYLGQLLITFIFFGWGGYYSINNLDFVSLFSKFKFTPMLYLVFSLMDLLIKGGLYHEYIHKFGLLLGVMAAFDIVSKLANKECYKIMKYGQASFFIYAMHILIISDIGKFLFIWLKIRDDNPYSMLVLYFFVPFFTIAVCYSTYKIMKRFSPSICSLLSGGR